MSIWHVRRRDFISLVGSGAAAWPLAALAQRPAEARRLGVLMPSAPDDALGQEIVQTLYEALRKHGWVEGNNLLSLVRWSGGDDQRRRAYAAELVRTSPDVIYACFAAQLAALARETKQIPIVFVGITDPVRRGYVASIARPGGNMTGFTFFEQSLVGKWLEILRELLPTLACAAVIVNPNTAPSYELYLTEFSAIASASGIEPLSLLVHSVGETESAIEMLAGKPASGLIVLPDSFTADNRELIATLALRYRLPTMFQFSQGVRAGGLLSYGPDQLDVIRRSAAYIDRIFKGERPSELPVQGPTKYSLVVNLKTAKILNLTVPPALLARADEVIE